MSNILWHFFNGLWFWSQQFDYLKQNNENSSSFLFIFLAWFCKILEMHIIAIIVTIKNTKRKRNEDQSVSGLIVTEKKWNCHFEKCLACMVLELTAHPGVVTFQVHSLVATPPRAHCERNRFFKTSVSSLLLSKTSKMIITDYYNFMINFIIHIQHKL